MKLEDLRLHAGVLSADGHKLGTLSRFVFNKDTLRLTHIVIDTGVLRSGDSLWKGGWGMSHDRVVPIGALQHADSDEIRISMAGDDFLTHSQDYIEERFERIPDDVKGRPDASDVRRLAASLPGEPGPYLMHEARAIAPEDEDIAAESAVWRLNPHQKIGEVERVVFDEETHKIQSLVIRRGFVFSKDVVLPASLIVEVVAGVVRVDIDDAQLRALEEFKPAD